MKRTDENMVEQEGPAESTTALWLLLRHVDMHCAPKGEIPVVLMAEALAAVAGMVAEACAHSFEGQSLEEAIDTQTKTLRSAAEGASQMRALIAARGLEKGELGVIAPMSGDNLNAPHMLLGRVKKKITTLQYIATDEQALINACALELVSVVENQCAHEGLDAPDGLFALLNAVPMHLAGAVGSHPDFNKAASTFLNESRASLRRFLKAMTVKKG